MQMAIINENLIRLDADLATQEAVFQELSKMAYLNNRVTNQQVIVTGLKMREAETTTGFGNGIAIPHTKNKAVKKPTVIVLRNKQLINWHSLDGKPVNTIISLLVPVDRGDTHLRMLAKLSRQMMHREFTDALKFDDQQQILTTISAVLQEGQK